MYKIDYTEIIDGKPIDVQISKINVFAALRFAFSILISAIFGNKVFIRSKEYTIELNILRHDVEAVPDQAETKAKKTTKKN